MPVCDFSMESAKSRPAQVGDELETARFSYATVGFCDNKDCNLAVCLLPGTEISFKHPATLHPWHADKNAFNNRRYTVAIVRQLYKEFPHRHHDFLEFGDGEVQQVSDLEAGQHATVLQLPAMPKTEVGDEKQEFVEFAD